MTRRKGIRGHDPLEFYPGSLLTFWLFLIGVVAAAIAFGLLAR